MSMAYYQRDQTMRQRLSSCWQRTEGDCDVHEGRQVQHPPQVEAATGTRHHGE